MTEPQAAAPELRVLSVLHGEPTPDELAAVLAVLASRRPARPAGPREPSSLWSARGRALGAPLFPAAGAWRASGLPG